MTASGVSARWTLRSAWAIGLRSFPDAKLMLFLIRCTASIPNGEERHRQGMGGAPVAEVPDARLLDRRSRNVAGKCGAQTAILRAMIMRWIFSVPSDRKGGVEGKCGDVG